MNLKTIATTTLLIGLGLTQPLSAQTILDAEQTVASAKPIKLDLVNSSLPSPNNKQLYIQIGIQPFYYSPVYWSWGLVFGNFFYNDFYRPYSYYNPYAWGFGSYGDRYYGNRYRRRYDYYSPAQIRVIYLQVLGREPDYRGLNTWLRQSRRASLYDIRRNIARSDEAVARINQIYREVLGRNADRDGIRTWTNRLASGATIYDVRRDIENSPEALSLRNRRFPRYNPPVNYSQPRRNIQPTIINPRLRDYSVPVRSLPTNPTPAERFPNRNFPRNTAPTVISPNRNLPPATLSPSNNRPTRRYSPPENYQQPIRRNSPSRINTPTTDYLLPGRSRRNNGSTFSPSTPITAPRIQR